VRSYHIDVKMDPVRCPVSLSLFYFLEISRLDCLNAGFGQFHFTMSGFEGDILIPAIPVSAHPPGSKATVDPSAGSSASASKTWGTKQKATVNPTPQKKAKKATRKSSSRIKINEPVPKASALTPPLDPQKGILIHRARRYSYLEYIYYLSLIIW
jgi:hypothetical protein